MSSSASLIPSPGVPVASVPGGNLLSSVPPPAELPSFITTPSVVPTSAPIIQAPLKASNEDGKEPFFPTTFRYFIINLGF